MCRWLGGLPVVFRFFSLWSAAVVRFPRCLVLSNWIFFHSLSKLFPDAFILYSTVTFTGSTAICVVKKQFIVVAS